VTFVRLLRINARQVQRIRFLTRLLDRQTHMIATLERERDEARGDAELLLRMVPEDQRRCAYELVTTRHDIERLDEVEE
jgi:hypothetical protein